MIYSGYKVVSLLPFLSEKHIYILFFSYQAGMKLEWYGIKQ